MSLAISHSDGIRIRMSLRTTEKHIYYRRCMKNMPSSVANKENPKEPALKPKYHSNHRNSSLFKSAHAEKHATNLANING